MNQFQLVCVLKVQQYLNMVPSLPPDSSQQTTATHQQRQDHSHCHYDWLTGTYRTTSVWWVHTQCVWGRNAVYWNVHNVECERKDLWHCFLVRYKLSLYTSEIRSWYKYVLSRVSTNTGPSVGAGVALVRGVSMLMMDGNSVGTS